jgi:F0F1-type ATP synthase assembly protein I
MPNARKTIRPDNSWLAYLHLGWTTSIALLVFVLGGIYLDKKFSLTPLLTIIGAVLGMVTSGYLLIASIHRIEQHQLKNRSDRKEKL